MHSKAIMEFSALHGSFSIKGLAKSRSTHASIIASVNRKQYASLALLRMTSLLVMVQAWQAQVAAHDASAVPTQEKTNILLPGQRNSFCGPSAHADPLYVFSKSRIGESADIEQRSRHKEGSCQAKDVTGYNVKYC